MVKQKRVKMKFEVNGYKGYKGKMVMSQAVVMKVLGMKNIVMMSDRFSWTFQIEHNRYGRIGVRQSVAKGLGQSEVYRFNIGNNKKSKKNDAVADYDTYFLLGFDLDWKNIEKTYIIPNQGRMRHIENVVIGKNVYSSIYGEFSVDSNPYNDVLHDLMRYVEKNDRIIMVDTEDIEKWLKT